MEQLENIWESVYNKKKSTKLNLHDFLKYRMIQVSKYVSLKKQSSVRMEKKVKRKKEAYKDK